MTRLAVHTLRRIPRETDLAGAVGDDECADDEVAAFDRLDRGANLLDNADVLVTHHLVVSGLNTSVGPQV